MSNGGSRQSVLVPAGDSRDGTGLLANDPLGLCVGSEGRVIDDETNSGAFTSMMRLASQLQTRGDASSSSSVAPLITIETEESTILVKSYEGHTVALRVPTAAAAAASTVAPTASNGDDPATSSDVQI